MAWLSTSGRYLHPDVQILVSHLEIFSSKKFRTSGNYPGISDMSVVDTQWYPGGWYLRHTPLSYKNRCSYLCRTSGRNKPGPGSIDLKSGYSTHNQSKVFFKTTAPIMFEIRWWWELYRIQMYLLWKYIEFLNEKFGQCLAFTESGSYGLMPLLIALCYFT